MVFDLLTYSNEFLWPYISMEKFLGFNPILQKFCEMISEITSSKTVWRIFLIFCRSRFINNFVVKNSFSENWSHQELNISRPIYFLKNSHTIFKILQLQISWKDFFSKDSGTIVFLWILWNFSKHLFYRTPLSDCFLIELQKFVLNLVIKTLLAWITLQRTSRSIYLALILKILLW